MNRTVGAMLVAMLTAPLAHAADAKAKPNIVFILADDLGYADVGVTFSPFLSYSPRVSTKASRGFAIQREGPLDMRLDPSNPLTAARIVNEWPAEQIELLLREYGEERESGRISRWIVAARDRSPLQTTGELAALLSERLPRTGRIHPATRTFQALRIAVNSEQESLKTLLEDLPRLLRPSGRAVFLTFHSLEEALVGNALSSQAAMGLWQTPLEAPRKPSPQEVRENPRARSARLWRAVRT